MILVWNNREYSIKTDIVDVNGKKYDSVIDVDDEFTTKSIKSRSYERFIKRMAGQTVGVIDIDGKKETITFAKENDRVKKGKKNHPVLGELLYAKGDFQKSVVVNISDSLKISFDAENFTSSNNSHGWLDANGWVTKQCFILSNNTIYPAFLRIARTADLRNILYAVNINIKEGVKVDKTSPKSAVKSVTPSDAKSNTSDIKSQEKLYKKASMTESRIDYLIADSGAGTRTDYAQSWIIICKGLDIYVYPILHIHILAAFTATQQSHALVQKTW